MGREGTSLVASVGSRSRRWTRHRRLALADSRAEYSYIKLEHLMGVTRESVITLFQAPEAYTNMGSSQDTEELVSSQEEPDRDADTAMRKGPSDDDIKQALALLKMPTDGLPESMLEINKALRNAVRGSTPDATTGGTNVANTNMPVLLKARQTLKDAFEARAANA